MFLADNLLFLIVISVIIYSKRDTQDRNTFKLIIMEKRIHDLEENARLLQKKGELLGVLLEKRDVEKSELLENLER